MSKDYDDMLSEWFEKAIDYKSGILILAFGSTLFLSSCGGVNTSMTPARPMDEQDLSNVQNADEVPALEPWPPPRPSTFCSLDYVLFPTGERHGHLGSVIRELDAGLRKSGYDEISYFSIPTGVALVTSMEQIQADGSPVIGIARWSAENASETVYDNFSLRALCESLFTSDIGYYRIMVITVNSRPVSSNVNKKMTKELADVLVNSGAFNLPDKILNISINQDTSCTALIYEFEHKEAYNPVDLMVRGTVPAQIQLEKSHVLSNLPR